MKKLLILALLSPLLLLGQTFPPPSGPGAAAISYGVTAVTESVDTEFMIVEIPADSFLGGRLLTTTECLNATDIRILTTDYYISCYNDAGSLGCYVDSGSDYADQGSAGFYQSGDVVFTTGTNQVTFEANVDCSLGTPTVLNWHWKLEQPPTAQRTVRLP